MVALGSSIITEWNTVRKTSQNSLCTFALSAISNSCKQAALMFKYHSQSNSQYKMSFAEILFLSVDQCPAGKFSSDGLGPLCRVCPKNSYQDQPGMTACKNCASGTETLQLAATSQEDCGGNVARSQALAKELLPAKLPRNGHVTY